MIKKLLPIPFFVMSCITFASTQKPKPQQSQEQMSLEEIGKTRSRIIDYLDGIKAQLKQAEEALKEKEKNN